MFTFPLLFSALFLHIYSAKCDDLNVGTTLFTKADFYKECWSSEQLALLTSRMILEDLLPSTSILVIDSNEFVCDLIEYFRLVLETVRRLTKGKTKHITLVALSDVLGGYLSHAVLPVAKYAFYAGLIDYESMANLLSLHDELKVFLRTNGQGWARPMPQHLENFDIESIPLQACHDKDACANIIIVEDPDEGCDTLIPLPFFDSLTRPTSVALPTKTNPLHNLETNSSSYILMDFVLNAYKCLQSRHVKALQLEKFLNGHAAWIDEQIMPRLADHDRFYAAFGGILRVRNTLKRLMVSRKDFNKQMDQFRHLDSDANRNVADSVESTKEMTRSSMILFAVLITVFVWFILGTMFICYRMSASRQDPKGVSRSQYAPSESSERSVCHPICSKEHRSGTKQMHISTCLCRDESTAVIDSNHTEHRLPSITEMSEITSTPTTSEQNSKFKRRITYPRSPTESTTCESGSGRPCPGKQCYITESDSETEETTEDFD